MRERRPQDSWVVALVALAALLAGCGASRSAYAPEAVPPLPGAVAPDSGTAALNTRLLTQAGTPESQQELPLGPGDLVEISVFEVPELSGLKLRVPVRGSVTLPLVGPVQAAGVSATELETAIRERLSQRYMHDPQVSVFVLEQRSQRVSVLGAVRKGGVYPMTSQLRVADALALAEGLADDADHVIYLVRRVPAGTVALAQAGGAATAPRPVALPDAPADEVIAAIDLDQLAAGKQELNVFLQSGDVVQVPKAGSFYVSGEVTKPGAFFLKSRTSLQQAITAAGGVTNAAAWSDVRIYRARPDGRREVLEFDLDAIEQGAPAPEILKSDVVVVGKSYTKAVFFGFVDFFKGIFGVSKGL